MVKLAGLAFLAGCLRTTEFPCSTDSQCGEGTCEDVGFCSFTDGACASGRRFGEHAGSYGGQCVGDPGAIDAGVDSSDAATDAARDAPSGCPGYQAITNGEAGHVYKLHGNSATWTAHRDTCAAEGGYLAIPGEVTELQAALTLAGNAIWIGISDLQTENTWIDVLGQPATFLPWAPGQPDDAQSGEDCVRASGVTFTDERCTKSTRAVCECVP